MTLLSYAICLGSSLQKQFHPLSLTYSCCCLTVGLLYASFASFISGFSRGKGFQMWKQNLSKMIRIEEEKCAFCMINPHRAISYSLIKTYHSMSAYKSSYIYTFLDINNSVKIRRLASLQSFCTYKKNPVLSVFLSVSVKGIPTMLSMSHKYLSSSPQIRKVLLAPFQKRTLLTER